jgi:hypothetical protein
MGNEQQNETMTRLTGERVLANGLAKLAGFEPAPKMQASGLAGGR